MPGTQVCKVEHERRLRQQGEHVRYSSRGRKQQQPHGNIIQVDT